MADTRQAHMRLGFSDEKVKTTPELRDCIEAVLMQSATLVATMLEGLRAGKGQSRGRLTALMQDVEHRIALDTLLASEVEAKKDFVVELRGQFFAPKAAEPGHAPAIRFDDFHFLDDFQLDANIEIAIAQQEVMQAVDDDLPLLDALVSSLLGMVSVQPQLNPIKPEAFVFALRALLKKHVLDDRSRSALLPVASNLMGRGLGVLYKDLNKWLQSLGVEPALPPGYVVNVSKPGGKSPENKVSKTMLTLDKLKRLLTGDFDGSLGVLQGGPRDFLHTVPASYVALEDLKLLEPMMMRLAERAKRARGSDRAPNMLEADPTQNFKMGQQLGEEVVRLMVENLEEEERLLPGVRQMVKDLEPVLLRLAQADPRFFSDRKHPARVLMDRITHRSLAFADENAEGFGWYAKSVSNAVQVLAGTNGDAPSFARVLRKLEEGWARDDAAAHKRQEEAAKALLHAEQRNLLAQKFSEEFSQKLKDRSVPDHVGQFLLGPWAQVLAESQLRADGGSDPAGFDAVVDDLLWSMQVQLTRRHRNRLVQMVPELLLKLRQGLQLIDYPEERIPLLFDDLITVHEQAFERDDHDAGDPSPNSGGTLESGLENVDRPGDPNDAGKAVPYWLGESEAMESGYLDAAADAPRGDGLARIHAQESEHHQESGTWAIADLRVGAWVEFFLNEQWLRAQLTWASPHLTLFMFVSAGGLAHSMSRRTMEQRRSQGLLRIVSGGDLVGDALDAVAQAALRNQMPPDSGQMPLN